MTYPTMPCFLIAAILLAAPSRAIAQPRHLLPPLLPIDDKALAARLFPESNLPFRVTVHDLDMKPQLVQRLRIAVTAPVYDDMGRLLHKLGDGYRHVSISEFDLEDAERLAPFEVVFVTCSSTKITPAMIAALKRYVAGGGILYASDLRYDLLAAAFPELVEASLAARGAGPQDVTAQVVDVGLGRILGSSMRLHFKSSDWRSAAFDARRARIYLTGTFRTTAGESRQTPLMCRLPFHNGSVFFTSFHNAAQNSDLELKLLQYTVFSAANARIEDKLQAALKEEDSSARDAKNLNLSEDMTFARQTFEHAAKGKLTFALGFRPGSARLQLDIITPSGARITHADARCFSLAIDDAPAGRWQYSVTGVSVPFDNFPYTIIVATK